MKVPLRFQITNFDCGAVSLLNAFSYLFDREEIPPELVRAISIYTLDCYDDKGHLGEGGTSKEAVNRIAKWITEYANENGFNVTCEYYADDEVTLDLLRNNIGSDTVLFVRCWQTGEHYSIITAIDEDVAYFFDPYYFDEAYYNDDDSIEMIFDEPFKFNRKVKIGRLFEQSKKDFSLCLGDKKECVVIRKTIPEYEYEK